MNYIQSLSNHNPSYVDPTLIGSDAEGGAMAFSYPITDQNHDAALAELHRLIDLGETDEVSYLAAEIDRYERERYPFDKPDPVAAIRFRMEQQELRQRDLIPYIGRRNRVSEVLNYKRRLSMPMIRRLHEGLGISLEILMQPYSLRD